MLLSSCRAGGVSSTESNDAQAIPDANSWAVELHVTGGFAGMRRSIYIGNNAKVIVKDARRKLYIERILTQTQLDEVAALLPQEQGKQQAPRGFNKCRDCFNYRLAYRNKGQSGRIKANDMSLAKTKDKALIHKLMAIQNQIIRSHVNKK